MAEPLTYEQLFDTLRREKSRDELQKLGDGFYSKAHSFLAKKKGHMEKKKEEDDLSSLSTQRSQIEYQNVQKILRDLYERRERKIVILALHKTRTDSGVIDTDALLPEERELYEGLVRTLTKGREDVLHGVKIEKYVEEASEEIQSDEPQEDLIPVRFIAPVPKFVGKNLEVFGPYEAGQTESLPLAVAEILLKKGRAEHMEKVEH